MGLESVQAASADRCCAASSRSSSTLTAGCGWDLRGMGCEWRMGGLFMATPRLAGFLPLLALMAFWASLLVPWRCSSVCGCEHSAGERGPAPAPWRQSAADAAPRESSPGHGTSGEQRCSTPKALTGREGAHLPRVSRATWQRKPVGKGRGGEGQGGRGVGAAGNDPAASEVLQLCQVAARAGRRHGPCHVSAG